MKNKETILYYNKNNKLDKFSTFINNNEWIMPVVTVTLILLTGLIEAM